MRFHPGVMTEHTAGGTHTSSAAAVILNLNLFANKSKNQCVRFDFEGRRKPHCGWLSVNTRKQKAALTENAPIHQSGEGRKTTNKPAPVRCRWCNLFSVGSQLSRPMRARSSLWIIPGINANLFNSSQFQFKPQRERALRREPNSRRHRWSRAAAGALVWVCRCMQMSEWQHPLGSAM